MAPGGILPAIDELEYGRAVLSLLQDEGNLRFRKL
jgi:hypothetical protein